ncbi:hypothetical protein NEIG_00635 [Nematocida sp. ERTm5]|nr:hypothetical protein NEIG_00635 [Nematocida sp. ERTm5]
MDIKEQQLREQIQKEFLNTNGNLMSLQDIQCKLIKIVLNLYKKDNLHNEKYTNLNNLAYNAFISLIIYHTYIIKEVNESNIINIINESIRISDTFINNIKSSDIPNIKKSAIYDLLNNLQILTLLPYGFIDAIKNDIYTALYMHIQNNNQEFIRYNPGQAMKYLCKPHISGKYSNFERVLNIITVNISNFTTYNDIILSNIHNLDLSDNDIYLLSLFISCYNNDLYKCMEIMNNSIIIKSKKITKNEIKKEFEKSHIKKILDLSILREFISTAVEFIKNGSIIIDKIPELNDNLEYMVNYLKGFYKVTKVPGVNLMISHIPGVKSKITTSICDGLPACMTICDMNTMVYLFFIMDKVMYTYTEIINSILKFGMYTFQEYEIYTEYDKYTYKKLEDLCYSCDMNMDEFNKNVITPWIMNIKYQLDMIFNEPLNISLNNVLNNTLQDIKPLGYKNKCFKPVDGIIDSINNINMNIMMNNPLEYDKNHNIMVNIESIKDTSELDVSKNEFIIMDEYTPSTYQNNSSTDISIEKSNSSSSDASIKFYDDNVVITINNDKSGIFNPQTNHIQESIPDYQTNHNIQAEVTSVVNDLITAVSDHITNHIQESIPIISDSTVVTESMPSPVISDSTITDPIISDPMPSLIADHWTSPVVTESTVVTESIPISTVSDSLIADPILIPIVSNSLMPDPIVTESMPSPITDPVISDSLMPIPVVCDPMPDYQTSPHIQIDIPVVSDPIPVVSDSSVTNSYITDLFNGYIIYILLIILLLITVCVLYYNNILVFV